MRHRATHLLHVLACAPVAALVAATIAPATHALAAAQQQAASAPAPYVVAIDPGHGGSPDNGRPDQLFDPGVVAGNGLQEKDVTLDVAKRLATLLRAEHVQVVMTRTNDSYVDIGPRMQAAIDAGAQLFVSIHFNSFTDPTTGGALILYPGDDSLPFAQAMSDALATDLQQYAIADDGVQSKPDLWVHATMPAVTVEGAYLTNTREANLLQRDDFRAALARAIRDGLDHQAPQIATLDAQISAWQASHHVAARAATGGVSGAGLSGGSAFGTLLRWIIALAVLYVLVHWRRRVVVAVRWAYACAQEDRCAPRGRRRGGARQLRDYGATLATSWRPDTLLSRPLNASQRRRRSAKRRAVLQRAARPQPTRRSVYDELWF